MDNERLKKILTEYETHLLNRQNLTSSDFNFISLNTLLDLVEIEITEETSPESFSQMQSVFNRAMRRGPVSSISLDEKENSIKDKFLRIAEKNYYRASGQIPGWKWKFDDLLKEAAKSFTEFH